ncbi:MAG: extracellular solute-binding protein [Chloroflexi bacterium]|nr:extracellular solute-binding protein [Chloroflexota bacterium]
MSPIWRTQNASHPYTLHGAGPRARRERERAVGAQDQTVIQLAGWASSDAENAALEAMVAAFEEANPDVDVEVIFSPEFETFMQTGFASGDYSNVFYVDSSKLQDWASARGHCPGWRSA